VPDQFGITHARFERVLSGEYLLWPLAAEPGATATGVLLVSEIDLGPRDVAGFTGLEIDPALLPPEPPQAELDVTAEPASGRIFMPAVGGAELTVTLEGEVPADSIASGCPGVIAPSRPDVTLSLAAEEQVLAISASSDIDTTLMVVGPGGDVWCNDDMVNYDPGVAIAPAAAGDYAIWVGIFGGAEGEHAVVRVGREASAGSAMAAAAVERLDAEAEPASGRHALPADGALEVALTLAGGTHASNAAPGCSGEIDPARPDVTVTLPSGEPELWFHASAGGNDTTLVVVGPDGVPVCNDDHDGLDPAVAVRGAVPGDYAAWVGGYGGSAGVQAKLTVGREAPAAGSGATEFNPFLGQPLESAADALSLLIQSLGLGDGLTYDRLEETGPEGLILHGVMLQDPSGAEEPVRIDRIRVSDLDLAGLSAIGAPERFALAFEGISYSALAEGVRANGLAPLPVLAESPPFTLAVSLLPPGGDNTRRELRLDLVLEGQLAIGLATRMLWQEGIAAMGPAAAFALSGEAIEIELHDMGFLGAALREIAAESGENLDQMIAEGMAEMTAGMGPLVPGSPAARLHEAISAKLSDLDRPGVLHIRLSSTEPTDGQTLFEALAGESLDESRFSLDIGYLPDG
jgi:hypothetical protein